MCSIVIDESSTIEEIQNFKLSSRISFTEPRKSSSSRSGLYNVYLNDLSTDQKLAIQIGRRNTPVRCPFGLSLYEKEKLSAIQDTDAMAARVDMSINMPSDASASIFEEIDEMVVKAAFKNQHTWFNSAENPYTLDQIRAMYTPCVRKDFSGKYPPQIKTKVNVGSSHVSNATKFHIFSEDSECPGIQEAYSLQSKILEDYFEKPFRSMCMVAPSNIWITKKSFGVTINTLMVLVMEEQNNNFEFDLSTTDGGFAGNEIQMQV